MLHDERKSKTERQQLPAKQYITLEEDHTTFIVGVLFQNVKGFWILTVVRESLIRIEQ